MSIAVVDFVVGVVAQQTKKIRRFLKKNRNRIVYRVQGGDGFMRNVYSLRKAIKLAKRLPNGHIFQGEQNARKIRKGNLTGIVWNFKRQWCVK